jgi:hypothetical protein
MTETELGQAMSESIHGTAPHGNKKERISTGKQQMTIIFGQYAGCEYGGHRGTLNDGNGSNSGHVRIYSWNGASWQQKGADIDGEAADDRSGLSVSMPDANTVALGAPL